jgi:hypothetical protein
MDDPKERTAHNGQDQNPGNPFAQPYLQKRPPITGADRGSSWSQKSNF